MDDRQIVVVAEDDDELRAVLLTALTEERRRLIEVEDGSELLDYLELLSRRGVQGSLPDLVFTDVRMPGLTGLEVVSRARASGMTCPFIILTGFADENVMAEAARLGKTTVLNKPQSLEAVREAARQALATAHVARKGR